MTAICIGLLAGFVIELIWSKFDPRPDPCNLVGHHWIIRNKVGGPRKRCRNCGKAKGKRR